MNDSNCWELIQRAHDHSDGDMDAKCDAMRTAIAALPAADAAAFLRFFDTAMDRAYAWPLWGAAYVIGGGCGDDAFNDFRASLISRGRDGFENALADPDSLATLDLDEETQWFYEGYQYAVTDGVEAAAGATPDRYGAHPDTPSGVEWDGDGVYALYPKLAEKYD